MTRGWPRTILIQLCSICQTPDGSLLKGGPGKLLPLFGSPVGASTSCEQSYVCRPRPAGSFGPRLGPGRSAQPFRQRLSSRARHSEPCSGTSVPRRSRRRDLSTQRKKKRWPPRTTSSREPLACRLSLQIPVHHAPERNDAGATARAMVGKRSQLQSSDRLPIVDHLHDVTISFAVGKLPPKCPFLPS